MGGNANNQHQHEALHPQHHHRLPNGYGWQQQQQPLQQHHHYNQVYPVSIGGGGHSQRKPRHHHHNNNHPSKWSADRPHHEYQNPSSLVRPDPAPPDDVVAKEASSDGGDVQRREKQKKSRCGLVALCAAALVCAFVVCIALLCLLIATDRNNDETPTAPPGLSSNASAPICLTSDCALASAALLRSLDPGVDPCADLYGFVCGGWASAHPIPRGRAHWSVTDQRHEDNLRLLRHVLERPMGEQHSSSPSERKAQLLYRSCMDSGGVIERRGAAPLQELIQQVGGWNLTGEQQGSWSLSSPSPAKFDLLSKLLSVQRFNTDALFSWYVREGASNTTQYEVFMHQGGLTLPSKEMYFVPPRRTDDEEDESPKEALIRLISEVVDLLGSSGEEHREEIKEMLEFETLIANFSDWQHEITGVFIPLSQVDSMQFFPTASAGWTSWADFFNGVVKQVLSEEQTVEMEQTSFVWVQDTFFTKLGSLVTHYYNDAGAPLPSAADSSRFFNVLNNYLTWRAIVPYLAYLDKDFQKAEKSYGRSLRGSQGREERWRWCASAANAALGFAVAPAFVREAGFGQGAKDKARHMMQQVKEAFKERLSQLPWVDPATAALMSSKIAATTELIGYPELVTDATALSARYAGFRVEEDDLFGNQVRLHRFALADNLRRMGRAVDRNEWPMAFPPATVNAFYMYSRNQMLFPAGVLQMPLFSEHQPMSLNFGYIGTFMGHELLHGFDDTGRLYGPSGEKQVWWPNSTADAFKTRADCFVRQYSQEVFVGRTVDGRRTLSENIADNGGLLAALRAFETWSASNPDAPSSEIGLLPGLQDVFSPEQLFFVGYARAHCSATRDKAMQIQLMTDRHAPSHVRVNTAVLNSPGFAEAFNCPKRQEERCELW